MSSRFVFRFALVFTLAMPLARGQQTVTFTNGETNSTAYSTTAPNSPTTLSLASGSATQSGAITGTGSLDLSGGGTLTLSNTSNTVSGATTVSAGELLFPGAGGLPDSDVTVNSGATIFVNNFGTATVGSLSGAGNVSFMFGSLNAGGDNASTTFSGAISGSGTLTKLGTGTLTFTGSNPNGAELDVDGGTLNFSQSSSAAFTGTVRANTGGSVTFSPADPSKFTGMLEVQGGAVTISLPNSTPLAAASVEMTTGSMTLSGQNATAFSTTTVSLGSGTLNLPDLGTVFGGFQGGGTIAFASNGGFGPNFGPFSLTVGGGNVSSTYSSVTSFTGISGGLEIFKTGTGTWTLAASLPGAPIVTGGFVALTTGGGANSVQLQGAGLVYSAAITQTGGIAIQTGGGTVDTGGNNVTLSGLISGGVYGGTDAFTKLGSGTLTITSNNDSFYGTLAINAGTVSVSSTGNLGNDSGGESSTVAFGGGTLAATASFTSGHPITLNTGGGTINVASGTTLAWNGAISGGAGDSLTKTGTGILQLSGTNTYSGATAINGGQINLNGSAANSAYTIGSGGTLSGNATVGALTMASGGTLSPGNSPGTINAASATFAGGATFNWQINSTGGTAGQDPGWDLLNVSGGLTITATSSNKFTVNLASLTLTNASGPVSDFNPNSNYSFALVSTTSGVTGFSASDFTLNTSGFSNTLDGTWSIVQNGDSLDLDYTTSAVPEPSDYALWTGGAALLAAGWRRRKRFPQHRRNQAAV